MKDPKTEQLLNNGGFKWTYAEKVSFNDIDLKASRNNPARIFREYNEDVVEGYMMAMARGDKFPAILLLTLDPKESGGKKYIIATGVHRVTAADLADIKALDAYVVVEADTYRREALMRGANNIEGHGVSTRDKVQQVLYLHEKYPEHSLAQLAKEWNLKLETVKVGLTEKQALARASGFGIVLTKTVRVSQKSLVLLNTINNDPVFKRALNYCLNHSAPPAEIEELVRDIKKNRDEASMLAVIDRYTAEKEAIQQQAQAIYGRNPQVPAQKLVSAAKRLNRILEGGIERLHMASYPGLDHAGILVDGLIGHLQRLRAELSRIERVEKAATTPHLGVA